MSDFSPRAKALMAAARHGHDPTERDRAQIRQVLRKRLGPAAIGGAALGLAQHASAVGTGVASASKSVSVGGWLAGLPLIVKWIGLGIVVGVASWGAYSGMKRPGDVSPSSSARPGIAPRIEPQPSAAPPPPMAPPPPSAAEPAETQPTTPRAPRRATVPPVSAPSRSVPSGPGLAEEARGLAEAHRLMDRDPERALALLDEQSKKYEDGALQEERAAARLFVLCRSKRAEARAAAKAFLERYPRSPLVDRVRSECLSTPR